MAQAAHRLPFLLPSGPTDVLPPGKEVEFVNLLIPPDKSSDQGPDKVALSVANLLKGLGDAEDAVKTPAVHLGDGLPPIPAKIATRILNGEFVDMVDLLPEAWSVRKGDESAGKKGAKTKKKSEDIHIWLQCYAVYVGVMATKHPERVPELMSYMINIIRASQEFENSAWIAYDAAYRRQAASTGHTSWSKINPSLYALCFTGKAKQGVRCSHCLSSTHKSEECTLVGDDDPDLGKRMKAIESAVLALATNPSTKPKQPPKPQEICRLYNERRCRFHFCRYRHVCQSCEGNHPISDCTALKGTRVQASQGSHSLALAKDHFINKPY